MRFRSRRACLSAALAASAVLGGCATTSVLSSENPSKNRPPQWADYWSLPVDVRGHVPGLDEAALQGFYPGAAPSRDGNARHVVMYVDPARLPADAALCSGAAFTPGSQEGRYGIVAGALCNGRSVVTYATARVLTEGLPSDGVRDKLKMMHLQLWQALTYGNNHPEQAHPSWMYGP